MNEKPILLNGEMVRAILDGRKTQTRRPVKVWWGKKMVPVVCDGVAFDYDDERKQIQYEDEFGEYPDLPSPFGQPGDRLWVRETWRVSSESTNYIDEMKRAYVEYRSGARAGAGQGKTTFPVDFVVPWQRESHQWRPSIHMPRWASRITLEVKRVWVERVQGITPGDAKSEGDKERSGHLEYHIRGARCHVDWFNYVWDQIYAAKGFGWDKNPWVWCCEFEVVRTEGEAE